MHSNSHWTPEQIQFAIQDLDWLNRGLRNSGGAMHINIEKVITGTPDMQ